LEFTAPRDCRAVEYRCSSAEGEVIERCWPEIRSRDAVAADGVRPDERGRGHMLLATVPLRPPIVRSGGAGSLLLVGVVYMFRGRRTVDGREDEGKFVETKYRCRSCSHEWWERIPAPPEEPRDDNDNAT